MTELDIRQYLEDNGYPRHVVKGGREGLIARWGQFVEEVEKGYQFTLEDYRGDLDGRAIIHLIGADSNVEEYDVRLNQMLTATHVRVWESAGGSPFWDFGYPKNARGDLRQGLKTQGLWET